MKLSITSLFVLLSFFVTKAWTQTGFKKGSIVTTNDEELDISLKFAKGKVIALPPGKRQKVYTPGELKSFVIDTINYISYSNDFYQEIAAGKKAMLYQKITDNRNEAIYNGSEAIGFLKTTVGKIGDFYVLLATETKLELINEKNFKNYFSKLFIANDTLSSKIADERLSYHQIKDAVEFYNNN